MVGRARVLGGIIVAALALGAVSATAPAAIVGTCTAGPGWPAVNVSLAGQVLTLVNQHRASIGRGPLATSPTLTDSAEWKSQHMAATGYFDHYDLDYPSPGVNRDPFDRMHTCGHAGGYRGENIAYGYATAQAVMTGWLNSSGHRQNIEDPVYTVIGIGVAPDGQGRLYWTQNFGSVNDSGTTPPPPTPPPSPPTPPPSPPTPPPAPPPAPAPAPPPSPSPAPSPSPSPAPSPAPAPAPSPSPPPIPPAAPPAPNAALPPAVPPAAPAEARAPSELAAGAEREAVALKVTGFAVKARNVRAGRILPAAFRAANLAGLKRSLLELRCRARIDGRLLHVVRARLAQAGPGGDVAARCEWRIPETAAGERLEASVTVVHPDGRARIVFAARVRAA
jgi:uncharacterized protein YkwD